MGENSIGNLVEKVLDGIEKLQNTVVLAAEPVNPSPATINGVPLKTVAPVPAARPVSVQQAVNAAQAATIKPPKGLTLFNTRELASGFLHAIIYSETSARKTVTAARFGSAKDVRIILTRRREQLIPIREAGYEVALVEDEPSLSYALMFPERLWPDWAKLPNRTLVLDDGTEAVNMLLEGNEIIDGKEVRDRRRTYDAAGRQLRDLLKLTLRKPQNFIMVALAKVRENSLTNEERIGPDLPPSMLNNLLTEMELCFYIKPTTWKFITERDFFVFQEVDEKGQVKTYKREIFAKSKIPYELVGKGIIKKEEDLDLAAIWKRVQEAKVTTGGVK